MSDTPWWQRATFYQIYPRSFADGNGDGIGDLPGIIGKLDYLAWLGVEGIWLSPHYPSPQVDVGYDIADYTAINPEYGTMDDFRELLSGLHARGMKIIIDIVLNHTSDHHHWFRQSRASRDNARHDWYVWHDAKPDGGPPNNWESVFGGSAWTFDQTRGQYYYHYFLKEQPDLNWRNPAVKQAMFDVLRFWLDMGVDGFRLDAIGTIFEDPALADHKSQYNAYDILKAFWLGKELQISADEFEARLHLLFGAQHDLPETFDLMREFRTVMNDYPHAFAVGETGDVRYMADDILHSAFNFGLLGSDSHDAANIRTQEQAWVGASRGNTRHGNTLNNHDQSRAYTHYGDGTHDDAIAVVSAALMLTLRGTPYLYYGEEIGMADYTLRGFDEVRDTVGLVYRDIMRADGVPDDKILADVTLISRDRCRTPMQWDGSANGGFSPAGVDTWLPVHSNHATGINVADQRHDDTALLHTYRRLIHLRRDHAALHSGDFTALDDHPQLLAFTRAHPDETCLILINLGTEPCPASYPQQSGAPLLFSSHGRTKPLAAAETLAPYEVIVAGL